MKTKRVLSLLLVLAMLSSLFSVTAVAADGDETEVNEAATTMETVADVAEVDPELAAAEAAEEVDSKFAAEEASEVASDEAEAEEIDEPADEENEKEEAVDDAEDVVEADEIDKTEDVVGEVMLFSLAASAGVKYIENGEEKTAGDYELVYSDDVVLEYVPNLWAEYYYVASNTTLSSRLQIRGNVKLIIADGATLYVPKGIEIPSGSSLKIYGQKNNTGVIKIDNVDAGKDAIGGGGTVSYYGATVTFRQTGVDYKNTKYLDKNGKTQSVEAAVLTPETEKLASGLLPDVWYVVDKNVTLDKRITVSGTVNLIVSDGVTLTATRGIELTRGNVLNVYGQKFDSGIIVIGEDVENNGLTPIGGNGSNDGVVNFYGARMDLRKTDAEYAYTSYYNYDGTVKNAFAVVMTEDMTVMNTGASSAYWYYVKNDLTINQRMSVKGTVNLILGDGATLNAKKGITVSGGNTLNIYAQSTGNSGKLTVTECVSNGAAIGGHNGSTGTIVINGGYINVTGGYYSAGIGGGYGAHGGTVIIRGGTVIARGGFEGAGIGGGMKYVAGGFSSAAEGGAAGDITIDGGNIEAHGNWGGAGIGGGQLGYGGSITINGGNIKAYGAERGSGIGPGIENWGVGTPTNSRGGTVKINGGTIYALCSGRDGYDPTGYDAIGGAITFGDNLKLSYKWRSLSENRQVASADNREASCRGLVVWIDTCTEHSTNIIVPNDEYTHSVVCEWCRHVGDHEAHTRSEVTYTHIDTSDNAKISVVAKAECTVCHDTITETAPLTLIETIQPTCTAEGKKIYTAVFNNKMFGQSEDGSYTVTLPGARRLGHWWTIKEYELSEDGTTITATKVCKRSLAHIDAKETVNATAEVTKEPTCVEEGVMTYTSDEFTNPAFEKQVTITRSIPALGHKWQAPSWVWNGHNATAEHTCTLCGETEPLSAAVTSEVTTAATCTE